MKKYEMMEHQDMGHTFYLIRDLDTMLVFAGYDFMGSVEWTDNITDGYEMGKEEAEAILADLEAADDEPAKNYPESIKTEVILQHLQAWWTNAQAERKRWGPEDRIYQRKVDWCIGMKELVEGLLGTPVNLQLDGQVTTGI